MSVINGPRGERLSEQLREWYIDRLDFLMTALSEDHPFGHEKLTPMEQWQRYTEIRGDPYKLAKLIEALEARYRGFPDARQRIEDDLRRFVQRMESYGSQLGRTEVAA